MPEVQRDDDGFYEAEIQDAVMQLNAAEAVKDLRERREYIALGNAPSMVFRTFSAEGGFIYWYVIAGDTTGRFYLAAPIRLQGFGLRMELARVFSRGDIDREQIDPQGSLSAQLNDALDRLGQSILSVSQMARVREVRDDVRRRFYLLIVGIRLEAETSERRLQFQIRDTQGHVSRWEGTLNDGGMVTIGRHSDNDLVLEDRAVSRSPHCEVKFEGGEWFVRDSSQNGTWLNNQRLPKDEWRRVRF